MSYSAYDIRGIFISNFADIDFLEDKSRMEQRYRENGIILFYYFEGKTKIVIKFYSIQNVPDKQIGNRIDSLNREYEFAKRVKHHPNIVNVFRHDKIRVNGILIGIVMFMEFFPMTLKDLIAKKKVFSDKEVRLFLKQLGSALETAHYKISQPLVHCDIKPSNIGVNEITPGNFQYKLMDFDVSKELDKRTHQSLSTTSTGYTPGYSPPEQVGAFLNRQGTVTNTIDIYSVGAIAFQMHTGIKPVFSTNSLEPGLPTNLCSKKWEKVFSKLCNTDPDLRPKTVYQILNKNKTYSANQVLETSVIVLLIGLFAIILTYIWLNSN